MNPLIIPFWKFAGGSCHDAVTPVEEVGVTLKLDGDCDGAAIGQ